MLLGVLPVMGACGGGGGAVATSGPAAIDPLTLLSGTYCSFLISGDRSAGRAGWGTWIGDGSGMFEVPGAFSFNTNGLIDGPFPTDSFTYAVRTDRELKIAALGRVAYLGGISADGSLAIGSSAADDPSLLIMGRKQGTHDNASLLGQYHVCAFFYYESTDEAASFFGSASFDGAGAGSATTSSNIGGVIGVPDTGPITYSVAADGTVTGSFSLDVAFTLQGAILANGELLVLSGGAAGQAPILVILVKAATGASNATLGGQYFSAFFAGSGTASPSWGSMLAGADASSPGMLTVSPVAQNTDGSFVLAGSQTFDVDYAVLPDGTLMVDGPGLLRGGVSQSGNVAAFCGPTDAGVAPQLWFLMR